MCKLKRCNIYEYLSHEIIQQTFNIIIFCLEARSVVKAQSYFGHCVLVSDSPQQPIFFSSNERSIQILKSVKNVIPKLNPVCHNPNLIRTIFLMLFDLKTRVFLSHVDVTISPTGLDHIASLGGLDQDVDEAAVVVVLGRVGDGGPGDVGAGVDLGAERVWPRHSCENQMHLFSTSGTVRSMVKLNNK